MIIAMETVTDMLAFPHIYFLFIFFLDLVLKNLFFFHIFVIDSDSHAKVKKLGLHISWIE